LIGNVKENKKMVIWLAGDNAIGSDHSEQAESRREDQRQAGDIEAATQPNKR
jgi:hypothetical protein